MTATELNPLPAKEVKRLYLIIGNSIAAISAVEALRRVDQVGLITIVSQEGERAYSPVLTPNYIAGELSRERLYLRENNFYRKHKVETVFNNGAVKVFTGKKEVFLESGLLLKYDRLLIATGARPRPAAFPGAEKEGVFVLRTLQDAEKIRNYARGKKHAVVLGGGPISLRTAWALRELNIKVSIIISSNRLLSRLLDEESAFILEEALLQDDGYKIYKNCDLANVLGKEKVEAVELSSGDSFPAELIIVGKGVIANKELVAGTEIATANGILTNERMETNLSGVYAAGDVAQAYDAIRENNFVNAIWPAAFAQGKVAGFNMGGAEGTYAGTVPMNVLDAGGVTVAMVGAVEADEEICCRTRTSLKKIYLAQNRIVGAVFMGNLQGVGLIHTLIRNKTSLERLPSPERLLENIEYSHLLYGHLLRGCRERKIAKDESACHRGAGHVGRRCR